MYRISSSHTLFSCHMLSSFLILWLWALTLAIHELRTISAKLNYLSKMDSDPQTIEEIEAEILSILEDCERRGLSKAEIREIFSPLGLPDTNTPEDEGQDDQGSDGGGSSGNEQENGRDTNRKRRDEGTGSCWKRTFFSVLMVIVVGSLAITYCEEEMKNVRFHVLAIARIALIKIQPYWDWTDMYYSRCLVRNPFFEAPNLNVDDCILCESLERIERVSNISQAAAIEQFIKRERPFIVTDAMDNWHIMKTDQFWFDNITEIYVHHNQYRVCNIQTNLRVSYGDIGKVMRKLYSPHTSQWFLHWENCQKESAKATRQFYKRPYFISNSLDFTGSNWVLMSSDFKGRVYKKIESSDSLLMLYQIRGFNHIRMSPRDTCRGYCPELIETLAEGEILVATNLLWIFEYIPGEDGDNLAILSEVSWPSLE